MTKRFLVGALAVVLGSQAFVAPAAAQTTQSADGFSWNGKVPTGRWIRIKNLNGAIIVGEARGDNVEVVATKRWRRGDPSVVRFTTETLGDGVLICALWGDDSSCDSGGYHSQNRRSRSSNNNNDVVVEFHVLVPHGVKVSAQTVNGAVTIDGATSDVDAGTVNGELDVATSGGRVNAENVNGGVHARLGRLDSNSGDMKFGTVNGAVTVDFSGDFGGDVEMQTVNGSLNTNFEMTVSGRMDPRHLRAHVGRPGGPRIQLETVNGNVELRRR